MWLYFLKKEDLNKPKDIPCLQIRRFNIIMITILPTAVYRFNTIPTKITMAFFTEIEKLILKFMQNCKGLWIVKTILTKKNKVGEHRLCGLKTYYKATIIKTVWYWHKDRHIDQWNRIESPEVNPNIYDQLTFSKGAKTNRKRIVFSTNSW